MVVIGLCGCGELEAGSWLGEPMFEIAGEISAKAGALEGRGPGTLRVALYWLGARDAMDPAAVVVEGAFPARYTMRLYAPPAARALRSLPDAQERIAVARILVYLDQDDDARWDPELEPVLGGSEQLGLIWAPADVRGGALGQVRAGFHLTAFGSCSAEALIAGALVPMAPQPSDARANLDLLSDVRRLTLDLNCNSLGDDPCLELLLGAQQSSAQERQLLIESYQSCARTQGADDPWAAPSPGQPCYEDYAAYRAQSEQLDKEDAASVMALEQTYNAWLTCEKRASGAAL